MEHGGTCKRFIGVRVRTPRKGEEHSAVVCEAVTHSCSRGVSMFHLKCNDAMYIPLPLLAS